MDVLSLPLGGPFTTVDADPPWPFDDKLPGPGRGAAKYYPLMSIGQIYECLPVLETNGLQIADDAHLYLWVSNSFLELGYQVVRAWGFTPKQLITWVKVTKDSAASFEIYSTGPVKVRMGMGRGFRNCTEQVIVAKRGKLPFLRKNQPNVFFAPREMHSRKPRIFYDIIESMSPGPYVELFARPPIRDGWAAWGDEVKDAG